MGGSSSSGLMGAGVTTGVGMMPASSSPSAAAGIGGVGGSDKGGSSSSLLDHWQEHLAIMANNRTQGDVQAIVQLGDRILQEKGEVLAAQVCYLVAAFPLGPYSVSTAAGTAAAGGGVSGTPGELVGDALGAAAAAAGGAYGAGGVGTAGPMFPAGPSGIFLAGSNTLMTAAGASSAPGRGQSAATNEATQAGSLNPRLVLVGADPGNHPRQLAQLMPLLRSEVYEWARGLAADPSQPWVGYLPFKLQLAGLLAEYGQVAKALHYCTAVEAAIRALSGGAGRGGLPPGNLMLLAGQVELMRERLVQHAQICKIKVASNESTLGKLGRLVDRTINNVLWGGGAGGGTGGPGSGPPSNGSVGGSTAGGEASAVAVASPKSMGGKKKSWAVFGMGLGKGGKEGSTNSPLSAPSPASEQVPLMPLPPVTGYGAAANPAAGGAGGGGGPPMYSSGSSSSLGFSGWPTPMGMNPPTAAPAGGFGVNAAPASGFGAAAVPAAGGMLPGTFPAAVPYSTAVASGGGQAPPPPPILPGAATAMTSAVSGGATAGGGGPAYFTGPFPSSSQPPSSSWPASLPAAAGGGGFGATAAAAGGGGFGATAAAAGGGGFGATAAAAGPAAGGMHNGEHLQGYKQSTIPGFPPGSHSRDASDVGGDPPVVAAPDVSYKSWFGGSAATATHSNAAGVGGGGAAAQQQQAGEQQQQQWGWHVPPSQGQQQQAAPWNAWAPPPPIPGSSTSTGAGVAKATVAPAAASAGPPPPLGPPFSIPPMPRSKGSATGAAAGTNGTLDFNSAAGATYAVDRGGPSWGHGYQQVHSSSGTASGGYQGAAMVSGPPLSGGGTAAAAAPAATGGGGYEVAGAAGGGGSWYGTAGYGHQPSSVPGGYAGGYEHGAAAGATSATGYGAAAGVNATGYGDSAGHYGGEHSYGYLGGPQGSSSGVPGGVVPAGGAWQTAGVVPMGGGMYGTVSGGASGASEAGGMGDLKDVQL